MHSVCKIGDYAMPNSDFRFWPTDFGLPDFLFQKHPGPSLPLVLVLHLHQLLHVVLQQQLLASVWMTNPQFELTFFAKFPFSVSDLCKVPSVLRIRIKIF